MFRNKLFTIYSAIYYLQIIKYSGISNKIPKYYNFVGLVIVLYKLTKK
jgi:hypothetical protein